MTKDFTTKKLFITFIVLTVVGLCADIVAFFIVKQNIQEIYVIESKAEEQSASLDQIRTLRSLVTDLQPQTQALSNRIISSTGAVGFIEQIEKMAKGNNVDITVQSVDSSDTGVAHKEFYEYLKLSLVTHGTWQNEYTFISLLETMPYKLIINSLSLTQSNGLSSSQVGITQNSSNNLNSSNSLSTTTSTTTDRQKKKSTQTTPQTNWTGNINIEILKHK